MPSPVNADARSAKLQTSYQNLATASKTLNTVSDQFSEAIKSLDAALNKLSPGVSAWVEIKVSPHEEQATLINSEKLGFAKTHGVWGLCIWQGVRNLIDDEDVKTKEWWRFNDAPRTVRLRAIERIPELLAELAKQAESAAKEITAGAEIAQEMLQAVNAAVAAKEKRQ
jgi:hypothetical protein